MSGPSTEPAPASSAASVAQPDRAVEAGRGALFIGFAKVFFMLTGFVQKVLLTRLIGAADYGVFGLVNGAVSLVNNTVVQGTVQSVSKFTAEDDARADAVKRAGLRLQAGIGALVALGFVAAAPWLARFHGSAGRVGLYRLVAVIPLFYAVYAVFVGSANGLRKFRVQATFDVTFSSLKTVLLLGGGVLAGVAGALGGFAAAALVIVLVAARVMGLPRAGGAGGEAFPARRFAAFMGGIVVYTLLVNLTLSFDLQLLPFLARRVVAPEEAMKLAAYYEGARNVGLLPHQALLVVTFVIFPLVSRSTFQNDRAATSTYVTHTLRYALILAAAMGVVLAARPEGLLRLLYPEPYKAAAAALPILVAGVCCLGLLGVAGSMINAAGRNGVAVGLLGLTIVVGGGAQALLASRATSSGGLLVASATGAALGMATGLVGALVFLRRSFAAAAPAATLARVAAAVVAATLVGRFVPGAGKIASLLALALAGLAYVVVLLVLGEFGATDRAKWRKILRLDRGQKT
jgi:stage V sporulation protein B